MKFFKQLLAAPAAIGLLVTGVDVKADDFSATTTLTGEANFTAGQATIEDNADHEFHSIYSYKIDGITSFTGSDALKVSIEAGNAVSSTRIISEGAVVGDNSLTISNLYYTRSLSDDLLLAIGPKFEMDALVSTTTSSYSNDGFFNGWWYAPNNLSNHPKDGYPGLALAYMNDEGFNAGLSHISTGAVDSTVGWGGDDSNDVTTLSLGYDGDAWGGGLIYTLYDDPSALFVNVYDQNGVQMTGAVMGDPVFIGTGAYWNVNDKLDISVGLDFLDFDYENYDVATTYSVGADYDLGPGTLSAGIASVLGYDTSDGSQDNAGTAYEVYYNWDVADGITVKPMMMVHALDSSGSTNWADETILGIETTFKF